MSILDSIRQAEDRAAGDKRAAAANAREILHRAEQEAADLSASILEEAREKAAAALGKASADADTDAGKSLQKTAAESAAAAEAARSKLPAAAKVILGKIQS